jgi:hypothetical protein
MVLLGALSRVFRAGAFQTLSEQKTGDNLGLPPFQFRFRTVLYQNLTLSDLSAEPSWLLNYRLRNDDPIR